MTLTQKIREDMKEAMIAKNTVGLNTLRGLLAAFTNELVAKKRKPTDELSDEEALEVVARAVKQRKDSIDQFRKGGREDLAASEEAELSILIAYLPKQLDDAEIEKIVRARASEMSISDKSKANQLMGILMKELKGRADGNRVREVIMRILA